MYGFDEDELSFGTLIRLSPALMLTIFAGICISIVWAFKCVATGRSNDRGEYSQHHSLVWKTMKVQSCGLF